MLERSSLTRPTRVCIVDDTRSVRALIRSMLSASPRIEIVGEAGDPYEARTLIRSTNPDVITLDVVMPRMSGLEFLEKLMKLRPMPVVMVSTRTTEKSNEAVKALALGAVECVDLGQLRKQNRATDLIDTVLMAANSNVRSRRPAPIVVGDAPVAPPFRWNGKVVAIGSSTGGVDALLTVLATFPRDCPPTLIAQHMPATFLESFASRLNKNCQPDVRLATDGAALAPGKVMLAPGGDHHTRFARHDRLRVEHVPSDGTEPYVPAVNQLFLSARPHAPQMVSVILTGMGRDGADAMLVLREAGAYTLAQDSGSSVIDGMPRAARNLGAAVDVATLSEIGPRILAQTARTSEERVT
jgi:two-component system chemotaxis response regulator CheB